MHPYGIHEDTCTVVYLLQISSTCPVCRRPPLCVWVQRYVPLSPQMTGSHWEWIWVKLWTQAMSGEPGKSTGTKQTARQKLNIMKDYHLSTLLTNCQQICNLFFTSSSRQWNYLEEMDMVLLLCQVLQLSLSPLQLLNLLFQLLQDLCSSTHCCLLLSSDQLSNLRASSLNRLHQLSENPVTVLQCVLCRGL